MKKLTIKPDGGMVKGGDVSYSLDPNGTVTFSLNVTAHYLFSDHQIAQNGTYHVSPDYLVSRKVKVGEVFELGKLKLVISSVGQAIAVASVDIQDLGSGTAIISLASDLIEIMKIEAKGSVLGKSVTLETA